MRIHAKQVVRRAVVLTATCAQPLGAGTSACDTTVDKRPTIERLKRTVISAISAMVNVGQQIDAERPALCLSDWARTLAVFTCHARRARVGAFSAVLIVARQVDALPITSRQAVGTRTLPIHACGILWTAVETRAAVLPIRT